VRERAFRARLKDMGDTIKSNLTICCFGGRRHGEWRVPDGTLRFKDIEFDCFEYMFGRFAPRGTSGSSAAINFKMDKSQATAVFGITKLRGGSMYATFEVRSMTITYQPHKHSLELSYKMG